LFSTLLLILLSINWNKSVKFYYCQYTKNISTSQHPFHTLVSSICHTIWCPCLSLGRFSMIYSCNYFLVLFTVLVPINSQQHLAFSIQHSTILESFTPYLWFTWYCIQTFYTCTWSTFYTFQPLVITEWNGHIIFHV